MLYLIKYRAKNEPEKDGCAVVKRLVTMGLERDKITSLANHLNFSNHIWLPLPGFVFAER
jgi:hypothetical protein